MIRAEIGGWTRDGHVRQTAFKGLEAGRDPREVVRERAIAPAKADRRGGRDASRGAEQVAAVTPGMARSATMPSPTQAAPDPSWLATPAELDALGALEGRGHLARRRPGPQAHEPRQGAVPAARRSRRGAGDEARADRATSPGSRRRCCRTSPTGRSTSSASRTAPARPGFWQKDIPATAPRWLTDLARDRLPRARGPRAERPPRRGPRGDAVLARQPGRVRGPRLDVHAPRPVDADLRADRHRPGRRRRPGTRRCSSRASTGRRSSTSASGPTRRRPARAASRPGSRSSAGATRTPRRARGSRRSRGRSARRSRTSCPGSGRRRSASGRARLDYTQNAPIKTLVAPYAVRPAAGRAGLRADRLGGAGRPDAREPTAGRSGTSSTASTSVGDLFAAAQTDHQVLPPL